MNRFLLVAMRAAVKFKTDNGCKYRPYAMSFEDGSVKVTFRGEKEFVIIYPKELITKVDDCVQIFDFIGAWLSKLERTKRKDEQKVSLVQNILEREGVVL